MKPENAKNIPYFGSALLFAARYSFTRNTGASLFITRTIIEAWPELSPRIQTQIIQESKAEAVYGREHWVDVWGLEPTNQKNLDKNESI